MSKKDDEYLTRDTWNLQNNPVMESAERVALRKLRDVLRERHYGRMPHEVQVAYDEACAVLDKGVS
jgi:hypothetical protein